MRCLSLLQCSLGLILDASGGLSLVDFVSRRTQFNDPCSLPGVFVAQWLAVADVGEGPGPPLFWQKKNNDSIGKTQKEEKPAGQAIFANQFCFNISKKTPTPLAQGLDPPLVRAFDRR